MDKSFYCPLPCVEKYANFTQKPRQPTAKAIQAPMMKNIAVKQQTLDWGELNAWWTSVLRSLSRYVFILSSFAFALYNVSSFFEKPIKESKYAHITTETHYGPIPLMTSLLPNKDSYNFFAIPKSYHYVDISRIGELTAPDFRQIVLEALPSKKLRYRLAKFLPHTLEMAQKYQVDPFWAIAVMWTESHFNPNARSYVNASGLMQVMPGTAHHILELMKRPVPYKTAVKLSRNPEMNIEMGIFYLRRLLKQFNGNYKLATVAYNMGPAGVRVRLRKKLPVGVRNRYLNKVNAAHKLITKVYRKKVLSKPQIYNSTFVVKRNSKNSRKQRISAILDFTHLDNALRRPANIKRFNKIVFL